MRIDGDILVEVKEAEIPANGHFIMPANVIRIYGSLFFQVKKLRALTLNEALTHVAMQAFMWSGLELFISNRRLIYIGNAAFMHTNLSTFYCNESLTHIGTAAFAWCKLETIVLNKNLRFIGAEAFEGCEQLKQILINSESVQDIEAITALLPQDLRTKVVPLECAVRALAMMEEQLKSIRVEIDSCLSRRIPSGLQLIVQEYCEADKARILAKAQNEMLRCLIPRTIETDEWKAYAQSLEIIRLRQRFGDVDGIERVERKERKERKEQESSTPRVSSGGLFAQHECAREDDFRPGPAP